MEFYELIEEIIGFIPEQFENLRHYAEIVLPWILIICTAATCLFGHKVHKIWNAFLFFWLGFFIPMFIIEALFEPTGVLFWICAVLSAGVGAFCAVYSKNIHRVKLFVTTFFLVLVSVPSYVSFLDDFGSIVFAFILAIAAGILSIKYKYIVVIITTSFSGSFMLFNIIESKTNFTHIPITIFSIIFALIGLAVQCYVEREELKETYEHLKERKKQIKSAPDKIKNKIKSDSDKNDV